MDLRRCVGGIFGVLAFGVAVAAGPRIAAAASVVMVDGKTGAYGYCKATKPGSALSCAEQKCRAAGGRNCIAIKGCPGTGYGAIARRGRKLGASCGEASAEKARQAAMSPCGKDCKIVDSFLDGTPPVARTAVKRVTPTVTPKGTVQTATKPAMPKTGKAVSAKKPAEPKPEQTTGKPVSLEPATTKAAGKPAAAQPTGTRPTAAKPAAPEKPVRTANLSHAEKVALRRQRLADMFIGRWSSRKCAERFWDIRKIEGRRYKARFWYDDVGMSGEDEFTVDFQDDDVIVLNWKAENPNKKSQVRNYVEKVVNLTEDSYTVFENNYRVNTRWTVHRCKGGNGG